jgi:hypothetical protein
MLTPDGRKFSELNQANDLRAGDWLPFLRLSEPLPDDQNVIISEQRLQEILGNGSGGTPGPSLPLYASPGIHTDGPLHQLAATLLAYTANAHGNGFQARWLTDAQRDADPTGGTSAETLLRTGADRMHLGNLIAVEFDGSGTRWNDYRVEYDGAPRTGPASPGVRVYRTGDHEAGELLPAKLVKATEARAFTPYASINGLTYLWHTNEYSSQYVGAPPAEQFFKYVGPDAAVAPAPTGDPATDAGVWEVVSFTAIPVVATMGAIPLTGTTPSGIVTGNVEFDGDTGVLLRGNPSDPRYLLYNSGGALTIVDADSAQNVVTFQASTGEMSIYAGAISVKLSSSPSGGLLVNGSPVGGSGYTDAQARAAQLNRTAPSGTLTVTLTAEAPTDYGTAANGTFTVDGTGAEIGKVVRFALATGATAPAFTNAPAGKPYKQLGASWTSGHAYTYSLLVCVDVIEVVCLLND